MKDDTDVPKHESAVLHKAFQFFSTLSQREQDMPSVTKLRHLFLNLAKVDFDAAARFLARIASQDSWNQNIRNVIDDLYQFIIPNDFFPEDIKSKAMAGLTASIEQRQFDYQDFQGVTEISQFLLYDVKPRGRDLRNAKLRLQANLFHLGSPEALTEVRPRGHSDLSLWIVMLQDAAWDDIVSAYSAGFGAQFTSVSFINSKLGHSNPCQCCILAARLHACFALRPAGSNIFLAISTDLPTTL
jgi:hypothetical protein